MKASLLYKILTILIFLCSFRAQAQEIKGTVLEQNSEGNKIPLVGANVVWLGTQQGATTDIQGKFTISPSPEATRLVISYVGYQTDTIKATPKVPMKIFLVSNQTLETIVVKDNSLDTGPLQSELLTTADLRKAACCNLSESFETNASVDVSTTDAVSGTKRIRMLGLDGVYAQIMQENIPNVRGLSSRQGLHFIPGSWIKSIDINKGSGSVVNGYESFTGQINVELAKPENSEKLLLNGYTNLNGRVEFNVNIAHALSEEWSTALLAHASHLGNGIDRNEDGFRDVPEYRQFNVLNRWKYMGETFRLQIGVKALHDDRIGGQMDFQRGDTRSSENAYGYGLRVNRLEGFAKLGFLPEKHPNSSLGLILTGMYHDQEAFWGLSDYDARQGNVWANLIYQTQFNPQHQLRAGVSYLLDHYDELYSQRFINSEENFDRERTESVPGIFAEYTYQPSLRWAIVPGIRADFHNLYGTFLSPRVHFKYEFSPKTIARLSAGRGFRVANPIAENMSYLISSRGLFIQNDLEPEIAWNYGGSIVHQFQTGERKGTLILDFYRTEFQNQVVLDLDASSQEVSFYNLSGRAFANSFQANLEYEILESFDVNVAYKYYDVKSTINGTLQEMPFVPRHRFFVNLAYAAFYDIWQFDLTTQWIGSQRIPNTSDSPSDFRQPERGSSYFQVNAQVTKKFKGGWEVYLGGENLLNYRQDNPIVNAGNPFQEQFDAGLVYAPVLGRMIYAGFRFTVPRAKNV